MGLGTKVNNKLYKNSAIDASNYQVHKSILKENKLQTICNDFQKYYGAHRFCEVAPYGLRFTYLGTT